MKLLGPSWLGFHVDRPSGCTLCRCLSSCDGILLLWVACRCRQDFWKFTTHWTLVPHGYLELGGGEESVDLTMRKLRVLLSESSCQWIKLGWLKQLLDCNPIHLYLGLSPIDNFWVDMLMHVCVCPLLALCTSSLALPPPVPPSTSLKAKLKAHWRVIRQNQFWSDRKKCEFQ